MTVHLVGAGPGDPELLTVKAMRLLMKADVIVYDRLVSQEILNMAPPWAEMINVGKDPNGLRTTQERINEILIDRGAVFETVVRLKGGDPFVFGRGGEEAIAVEAAGIAVTVVPGITSSIAAPAAAGIPVTHRSVHHAGRAHGRSTSRPDPHSPARCGNAGRHASRHRRLCQHATPRSPPHDAGRTRGNPGSQPGRDRYRRGRRLASDHRHLRTRYFFSSNY